MHGGTSPSHNAAADKTKIKALATTYGEPENVSPGELILREIRYSAGHVSWLRAQLQALEASMLVWGDAEHIERVGGNDAAQELVKRAGINTWLQIYDAERKLMLEMTRIALANQVDQRLLQLEELKAGAYLAAIDRITDAILDPLVLARVAQMELAAVQRVVQAARSIAAQEVPRILVMAADAIESDDVN